jgi:ribosomal protein S18 acetylase RimI-like enzyme
MLSWAGGLGLDGLERERVGVDLPDGRVPATFLVADVAGVIVGRVSVRHELNDRLSLVGGHIGYAVRPSFRRRGYVTAMLRHALGVARSRVLDQDDREVRRGLARHRPGTGFRHADTALPGADRRQT